MDKKNHGALLRHIVACTEKFARENGYVKGAVEKKVNKKERAILDAVGLDWGCHNAKVQKLVSALSGISIERLSSGIGDRVALGKFVAFIPLKIGDGHNYPLNELAICNNGNREALRRDGTQGNWMFNGRDYLRPATKKEIMDWATDAQLKRLSSSIVFV